MAPATDVAVLVPWRPGDPHREASWAHLQQRHLDLGRQVIEGRHDDGPWCKAAAVATALRQTDAGILVVHDADVWCDGLDEAIAALDRNTRWAIPHLLLHRLAEGEEPYGSLAQKPYQGYAGGGIVVIDRDAYLRCPLDPRFLGWGSEDECWAFALTALYGLPWRGGAPLWHWWHPPQPRRSRAVGSHASEALKRRYLKARTDRAQMLDLIAEARMGIDLKLDDAGMAEVLKSPDVAGQVDALAEQIAANVRAQGQLVSHGEEMPVTVDTYTTDRGAASVTITHPAGLAVQAKHGALTSAAAEAGLEVKAR